MNPVTWPRSDLSLPPGGGGGVGERYSSIKVTGVLVVPFRGLNLWIGTAYGAKSCQSCLGKIYDNTFKKSFEKKVFESYLYHH